MALNIERDDPTRIVYSTDNSVYQVVPEGVAVPVDVVEIAELLATNHASDAPRPIVARGGGTGTNGQSLTDGISVDLKRNIDQLIDLDVTERTVVVEPGMVTARLNHLLAPHGLFWPPHTSTLNRATVGGMISTDAAGKGSLVHGRAHRHVRRLDVVLADGTPWVAEPLPLAEAEERATGDDAGARLWRALLDLDIDDDSAFDLPELARGFSGYGIDRFRRDGLIDPTALLCGAEGTLAIITRATLSLHPLPVRPRLAVAVYPSFDDALADSVRLRSTGPSAIEAFDETTLERGRSSQAWPALGSVVGEQRCAVLLLEYTEPPAIDELQAEVMAAGRCLDVHVTDEAADQAAMWKVRADAVGLLAKVAVGAPEKSARPTAFVEDCAVPVEEMPAFIRGFRTVLDEAGVVYGMFGHADVGCVHVRPALDLTQAGDRALHAEITDRVTDLVHRHGGILWGEHGRGFRGARVDDLLDPSTIDLMRQVKSAFDPNDLLNPGKLYRPVASHLPLVAVDAAPLRGERDEAVPVELRRAHGDAFSCNGNGLCQQWSAHDVMCPSYVASGDPALSPKGRADLVREWLAHRKGDAAFEQALVDNLNQCLSCGACSGQCPVSVDIPELKSRVLDELTTGASPRRLLLSRFELAAHTAAVSPPALVRPFMGLAERATGLVDLPAHTQRRRRHRRFSPTTPGDIAIVPDVFTGAIEAGTLAATIEVLEGLGLDVSVAQFRPSGKFDHVKGSRSAFAKAARRQRDLVRRIAASGARPVVIEPAIALLYRHEYPAILAESDLPISTLPEVLLDYVDGIVSRGGSQSVTLLGHCTERATASEQLSAWQRVLEAAGYSVEAPKLGCCGMAGVFGHEPTNQQMSKRLWELSWQDEAANPESVVIATGYSCRSQGARYGATMRHPIELLR